MRTGRLIDDAIEFRDWIGKMATPSRQYGDQIGQMMTVSAWSGLCAMTLITPAVINANASAKRYIDSKGEWFHSAGRTVAHNWLGMAWAQERIEQGVKIDLLDSPDIRGEIDGHLIAGDVGRCTYSAWFDGFRNLRRGDLWISVIDYDHEVVLEPQIDIANLMLLFGEARLPISDREPTRAEMLEKVKQIDGMQVRSQELADSLTDWLMG